MTTTPSKQLPCCCETEKLFERLRAAREDSGRSELLARLIEEISDCDHVCEDVFHPWRAPTRSEQIVQSQEAKRQREDARLGLHGVIGDSQLSFQTKLTLIGLLVDGHVRSAQRANLEARRVSVRRESANGSRVRIARAA